MAAHPAELSSVPADVPFETPPLSGGMTFDDVLDEAARGPEKGDVKAIPDQRLYAICRFDQLEGRVTPGGEAHLGWEDIGWLGADLDRLWWKNEGE